MKNIFYSIGLAVLSLTAVCCSDDKTDDPKVVPTVDGITMLSARVEMLAIDDNGTTRSEVQPRVWDADARVGVFGSELGDNTEYKLFSSYGGAEEGVFYGDEVQGVLHIYYPYNEDCVRDGSKIVVALPESQKYDADFGIQLSAYKPAMVAAATTSAVEFRYVVGAIGVQVQGGSVVKRITVQSGKSALAGDISVDFARNFEVGAVETSAKEIVLDCGDGAATSVSRPTTFFILVPAGTYDDLTVTVETDGDEFSKTLDGAFTVNRLTAVDTSNPMGNATIVAEFDVLEIAGQSYDAQTWPAGAVLGVFGDGLDNAKYVIAEEEVGKKAAVFAGKELSGEAWAYYPWSNLAKKQGDVMTVFISSEQTYDKDIMKQFAENAPFMLAKVADGENIRFKYLNGALGIRVKADCRIARIDITAEEGVALSGMVNVDLADDYAVTATEGSKNTLTLNCGEEGIVATYDEPTTLFVMLPAGTYDNLAVSVTSVDGSVVRDVIRNPVEVRRLEFNESADDISYSVIDVSLEQVSMAVKKSWSESDAVIFYDADNHDVSVGNIFRGIGVGSAKATFTTPSENVYGVYLPSADPKDISVKGSVVSFALPAVQAYDASGAIAAMPMAGKVKDGVVELKNLCSVISLNLSGDVSVSKIVVKSASKKLSGTCNVDMSYEEAPAAVMASSASDNVTVDCGEGFDLGAGARKVNVVLPPATYGDDDLRIDVYTNLGVYRDMRTACVLERAAMSDAAVAVPQPVDLTAGNAFANCFILNERGWYSFAAKTRGGYTSVGSENMLNANTAAYVLFELNSEMVSGATYLPEREIITFNYDGSIGNAGICIADSKDNIQWTWTLWCPGEEVKEVSMGEYKFLDRNIGAGLIPKSAAEAKGWSDLQFLRAAGMIFEMGRPTPFPGADRFEEEVFGTRMGQASNTASTKYRFPSAGKLTNGQKFQCGVGKVVATSDLGVKDPLYYFILKNVTPDPQRYWSNDFKLDTSADSYPWNYSIAAHMQYDPCPAGYKLPSVAVMKGALSAYTWSNVVSADMTHPDGLYSETDGEFRYIPGGGYRQGYGLFLPFKGASGSTKHTSCHFLCSTLSNGADNHNRAYIGVTGSHGTGSSKWETGNGAQVRCVKE